MTTRRIFLSDIHMGDDRSVAKNPYPYCWFYDQTGSGGRPAMEGRWWKVWSGKD